MAGKPCDCLAVRRMIREIEEDSLERTGGHVRYVPYLQCLYVLHLHSICTAPNTVPHDSAVPHSTEQNSTE